MVLAHSAGVTECQPLNHEHSLYLPLRKTPEDTFRNTGKRPTQGRGVEYKTKSEIRAFCRPRTPYRYTRSHISLYTVVFCMGKKRIPLTLESRVYFSSFFAGGRGGGAGAAAKSNPLFVSIQNTRESIQNTSAITLANGLPITDSLTRTGPPCRGILDTVAQE